MKQVDFIERELQEFAGTEEHAASILMAVAHLANDVGVPAVFRAYETGTLHAGNFGLSIDGRQYLVSVRRS